MYVYVCVSELVFRISLSNLSPRITENRLIVIKSFSLEKNQLMKVDTQFCNPKFSENINVESTTSF